MRALQAGGCAEPNRDLLTRPVRERWDPGPDQRSVRRAGVAVVLPLVPAEAGGGVGARASGKLAGVSGAVSVNPVGGPIGPNCRQALRETLRSEQVAAVVTPDAPRAPVAVTYCGSCGWTLAVNPAPRLRPTMGIAPSPEVANPEDASTLAGQFQVRCRDLIVEIIAAGFTPGVWIELINTTGAV